MLSPLSPPAFDNIPPTLCLHPHKKTMCTLSALIAGVICRFAHCLPLLDDLNIYSNHIYSYNVKSKLNTLNTFYLLGQI